MLCPEALKTYKNKIISGFSSFYQPKYKVESRYPYLYKRDINQLKINFKSITGALNINQNILTGTI